LRKLALEVRGFARQEEEKKKKHKKKKEGKFSVFFWL
jgi:hypothetical protein